MYYIHLCGFVYLKQCDILKVAVFSHLRLATILSLIVVFAGYAGYNAYQYNNCLSGQVWDSSQNACRQGFVPYSLLPKSNDPFDYEDNDAEKNR